MKRIETCERCGGLGSLPSRAPGSWDPYVHGAPERVECPDCEGAGVRAVEEDDGPEMRTWTCETRVACEGTQFTGVRLPIGWSIITPREDEPLYRGIACPACTVAWLKQRQEKKDQARRDTWEGADDE